MWIKILYSEMCICVTVDYKTCIIQLLPCILSVVYSSIIFPALHDFCFTCLITTHSSLTSVLTFILKEYFCFRFLLSFYYIFCHSNLLCKDLCVCSTVCPCVCNVMPMQTMQLRMNTTFCFIP